MTELSKEARSLLRSAEEYEPSDARVEAHFRAVEGVIAKGALSTAATEVIAQMPSSAHAGSAIFAGGSSIAAKVALLAVMTAGGSFVGWALATEPWTREPARHAPAPREERSAQAREEPRVEPVPAPAQEERADPAEAEPADPTPVARVRPTAADALAEEAHLVGRAQTLLREGRYREALRAVEQADRRFPAGALGLERETARIVALCRLGRADRTQVLIERFVAGDPPAHLSDQIEDACGR